VSQFHFDPDTYMDLMRSEVPLYEELQEAVAGATESIEGLRILDLGTGTGETLARVLPRHPGAEVIGLDESAAMLGHARSRLDGFDVDLRVGDLLDPWPEGPFDLVVSALAVHHLDGPGKAELFKRAAEALRPGGRLVLGDVIIPDDPTEAQIPLSDDYDKPSSVADQLDWLAQAGLVPVVVWRQADLAVISADRPSPGH
jgi:tRNA (cmo5U34)-methyltransferase